MNFKAFSLFRRRVESALPPGVTLTTPSPVEAQPPPAPNPTEIEALTAKISSLQAERDQAVAFNADLSAKFEQASNELSAIKAERDGLITERDTFKAAAEKRVEDIKSEIRNTELAALAASQGIPAAEIVPAAGPGTDPEQELNETIKAMQATTDPMERGKLAAKAATLRANLKNKK